MRVLITGGSGFIGLNIAKELLVLDHEVCILDVKKPEPVLELDTVYFNTDIRNTDDVNSNFSLFKPDVCIHCAAQISVQNSISNPANDAFVNVYGSINIANAAARHCGTGFIFASSGGGIYGNVPVNKATVGYAENPSNPYAQHKLVFERILQSDLVNDMSSIILRYSNVYGRGQKPDSEAGVVSIFNERIKNNEPITIFGKSSVGDFGCIRDYIHVSDIVKANIWAINELKNTTKTKTINCCTGIGTNTAELANIMFSCMNKRTELHYASPRVGDIERSVLDESEFHSKIGFAKSLYDGIAETV